MKISFLALALSLMLAVPNLVLAHSPIFDCFDNGDGTISCQGGFSDGSSASGVKVYLKDASGKTVQSLTLDANSECTIDKPKGEYKMEFDAGDGHSIAISGENIVE